MSHIENMVPTHGGALSMIMVMAQEACGAECPASSPSASPRVWHFILRCTSFISDLTSSQKDR